MFVDNSTILYTIKAASWTYVIGKMLKTITFLTLLAACLSLPVDEVPSVPNKEAQDSGPQENAPSQLVPQDDPLPPPGSAAEGKPDGDLKTDPTFWFGYRYPYYRRSYYSYYTPRYYSYSSYPSYYWSSYW